MAARAAFTSRTGGRSAGAYAGNNLALHVGDDPSAVRANRAAVALDLGLRARDVVWMQQVHGTRVVTVEGRQDDAVPEADGLVTRVPGIALAVLVADCIPVLLVDEDAGVVAAVHAGRRGAASGVAVAALTAMRRLGAKVERTRAILGPAICGECYEVPQQMQRAVGAALPAARCASRLGKPALDLRAGLAGQLSGAGVRDIDRSTVCTAEDPTLFSHRRDGVTGRQAALVWLS